MISDRQEFTSTIAQSASLGSAVVLGSLSVLGVVLPTGAASFEATTTQIRFQVSLDGTTYGVLADKDGTAAYVAVVAANTNGFVHLDPAVFAAWKFVKPVTTTSDGTAVAQATAARTIKFVAGLVVGN